MLLVLAGALASCHRTQAWHGPVPNQAPTPGTCDLSQEDAESLNGDIGTDVHAVGDYTATISHLLQEQEFEKLDCLADRARSTKERFAGGTWKLHELYRGLSEPVQYPVHGTTEDWDALLERLQSWTKEHPESVTARVALATAHLGSAADVRGNGGADTVSESGRKLIADHTAEAKRILQEALALPTKCPEWYVAMLEVAHGQNWSEAAKRALFDEATKFEPGYYYYAQVVAADLLPKWGGKPGDTEKFMQDIADRVGGQQGDILYFQIATIPGLICTCDDDPHLALEKIERGFEATERQYGVSLLNLNRVAFLAARARPDDEVFADKAFRRIGDQWDEETWVWPGDFEKAKNFAAFMGDRLNIEMAADSNMKTPEGLRYRTSFEKPYSELLRQCVRPGDDDAGTFKTLTKVGENGTVEDIRIYSNSSATVCLYGKLLSLQRQRATPFPPPPHAPYWVRLDLNWADFASLTAK